MKAAVLAVLCSLVIQANGQITNVYELVELRGEKKPIERVRILEYSGNQVKLSHSRGVLSVSFHALPKEMQADIDKAIEATRPVESAYTNTYVATGAALQGKVKISGRHLLITNANSYMWGTTRIMINRGFFSDGYFLDVPMISAGETIKAAGTDFSNSKGERFQPWSTVIQDVVIRSNRDDGKLESIVPAIEQ